MYSEEIAILKEVMNRFKDYIIEVRIDSCMLGDLALKSLVEYFVKLHALKILSLTSNNLTSSAVLLLCKHMHQTIEAMTLLSSLMHSPIRLKELDLRHNRLTQTDAELLYKTFHYCLLLNGVPVASIDRTLTQLSLTKLGFRASEMYLVCAVLKDMHVVSTVNLSSNSFDVDALKSFILFLSTKPNITSIDISNNILATGPKGNDFSAFEELTNLVRCQTSLVSVDVSGNAVPYPLLRTIEQSLQVNRSIQSIKNNTNAFENFLAKRAEQLLPCTTSSSLDGWTPCMDIDKAFCEKYGVELCDVKWTQTSIHLLPVESSVRELSSAANRRRK